MSISIEYLRESVCQYMNCAKMGQLKRRNQEEVSAVGGWVNIKNEIKSLEEIFTITQVFQFTGEVKLFEVGL